MKLTSKERHYIKHGVLTAITDIIHMTRDLGGSSNPRKGYWAEKTIGIQELINKALNGEPVKFKPYTRKWKVKTDD